MKVLAGIGAEPDEREGLRLRTDLEEPTRPGEGQDVRLVALHEGEPPAIGRDRELRRLLRLDHLALVASREIHPHERGRDLGLLLERSAGDEDTVVRGPELGGASLPGDADGLAAPVGGDAVDAGIEAVSRAT